MRSLSFLRRPAHHSRPALTLAAALMLACVLSACGGGSSSVDSPPATAVPDTTPKPEMRCAP